MSETVRYFQLAGVTLEVSADLPLLPGTFEPKLNLFEVDGPGPQRAGIHHHFSLPDLDPRSLGREVYRQAPWLVYRDGERWTYTRAPHSSGAETGVP